MTGLSRLLLATATLAALVARPRLRNWGATPGDRARILPGDGLLPGERGICTMATAIAAPPAAVWPWLAQMGTERAGWYSWDHLDNGGRPSARFINPSWLDVREGDRLVSVPDRAWFDVVHVESGRSLVLRAALDLRGRPYDSAGPRPRAFVDARWEFFLEALADGSTRLLVRSGSVSGPRWLTDPLDYAVVHPAHVVMQIRQLHQVRARIESQSPHPS